MIRRVCYLTVKCPHAHEDERTIIVMIPVLIRQGQPFPWNHRAPKVLAGLAFHTVHLAGFPMQDAYVDDKGFYIGSNPDPQAVLLVEQDEIDLGSW